ncbi:MAG TPA: DUF4148 domain-containing protein [Burkholderiaceae bacterium]|nr:DUF4148 domain-containing protein [Burkholderiaceae bacterium]
MFAKKTLVALAATLAAAGAFAQEATAIDRDFATATPSVKTRAEVRAELAQARARGEVIPALVGEASVAPTQPTAVARTREEVRREAVNYLREHRFDRDNAFNIGG